MAERSLLGHLVSLTLVSICIYRTVREVAASVVNVVSQEGDFLAPTAREIYYRSHTSSCDGMVVQYTADVDQDFPLVAFPCPDRRDARVACDPNLVWIWRETFYSSKAFTYQSAVLWRLLYPTRVRIIHRTSKILVSKTLLMSLVSERFGLLRGKTYDEGRRIMQNYADTQTHTQVDLNWNLQGEYQSLAMSTVEYATALALSRIDPEKSGSARCYQ
jgi:hypothetical protein